MLRSEVLEVLTVEEWMKFKEFMKNRPIDTLIIDGHSYPSYPDKDVHEFLTVYRAGQKEEVKG